MSENGPEPGPLAGLTHAILLEEALETALGACMLLKRWDEGLGYADRLILLRGRRRAPMHAVLVPQLHKAQALAQLERQAEAHALLDAVQKAATADDDSAIVYRAVVMRLNQDLVRGRFTEAGGIHERALALAYASGQSAQRVGAIHAELVSALIASLYARS